MERIPFSPKEFLKRRRPERFSDSVYQEVTELDRSLLEYHLDSLTSRGQETDFERFARRLAEYEVCPNLLPQTGPTGGGDSKVDSETYPVADALALAWFSGIGREASQERWAFAFSAKKDWLPKVKSDVGKIAATSRAYTKAFFITNQTVSDRKRAEVEDQLRTVHSLDVRILDRTWILDRIFINGRESLAIEELEVTGFSRRNKRKGPLDTAREDELAETDTEIEEMIRVGARGHALVDDCLEAADLARQLERPRAEVEGRYSRLDRLALEYGSTRQQVESAYQWAWTLYWWFEDLPAFGTQYVVVEERAEKSRNAYDLERLFTIWQTLFILSEQGAIEVGIELRTEMLIAELTRLSKEIDRPSTVLQAETMIAQVEMLKCVVRREPIDDALAALQHIVQRSKGLVGYPLDSLVTSLTEVGARLEGSEAYSELFETIVSVSSARDGEAKAAQLLLKRGAGQLEQERTIEAIATLGRALGMLYKHETRHDIVRALYLCGVAYESAGLLWAARGAFINAASIATNDLWQYGDVTPQQVIPAWKLKWIELRLGRLPQLLVWHEVSGTMKQVLQQKGWVSQVIVEGEHSFDSLLARLLLRTGFSDLTELGKLPDVLDQLELPMSSDALLYALGHDERFAEGAEMIEKEPSEMAFALKRLEADASLAEKPVLYKAGRVTLQSKVLGCRIVVETDVSPLSIEVAESFLAALESFLATSVLRNALAREPILSVDVQVATESDKLLSCVTEERHGRPYFIIYCQDFDPHNISVEKVQKFGDDLFGVVVEALANVIVFRETEKVLELLFREEKIVDRSISFARTVGTQANVLGFEPKTLLSAWIKSETKTYALMRTEPWDVNEAATIEEQSHQPFKLADADTEPPPDLLDPNKMTHDQIEVISLIRERLWNRAGWTGVFFMRYEDEIYPPFFNLVFKNKEAGSEIFRLWREELGWADVEEKLRVAVIRGVDKANPYVYRVVIGSNPAAYGLSTSYFNYMYRVNTMNASTPENLDDFIRSHEKMGSFFLAPAFVSGTWDGTTTPDVDLDLRILVHHAHIRLAWEIGLNDIDASGIQAGDKPIIPKGVVEAPVLKILKKKNNGESDVW